MDALSVISPTYVINYVVMSCVGVWVTYYLMGRVFEHRHASLVWWAYFVVKGAVHGCLVCGVELGGSAWFSDIIPIEASLASILSLLVMLYTWKGDYVEVAFCAVTSDTISGALAVLCHMAANVVVGHPFDRGWVVDLDLTTIVDMALRIVVCLAFKRPFVELLGTVRRLTLRNHLIASCIIAAYLAFFAIELSVKPYFMQMSVHISYIELALLPILLGMGLITMRRAWGMSRREQMLNGCMLLAKEYDRTVRDQLSTLNADLVALDGHETSLARLRENEVEEEIAERIRALECTYRRLCAGNYCAHPVLDAVLSAGVRRLRDAGVRCEVTVAGLPSGAVDPAMTALTMLNVAAEAAERSGHKKGTDPVVELRVRGLGSRALLHMDVPAGWGRLGARRALSVLFHEGEELIAERKREDRTVVLVVTAGEGQ